MMRFRVKKGLGLVTLPGFGSFNEGTIVTGDRLKKFCPTFLEVYTGEVETPVAKPEPIAAPVITEVTPAPSESAIQEQQRFSKRDRKDR
jgi:hypothetical protein